MCFSIVFFIHASFESQHQLYGLNKGSGEFQMLLDSFEKTFPGKVRDAEAVGSSPVASTTITKAG